MVDDKLKEFVQEELKRITIKVSIHYLAQKKSGFRGTGFFITPNGYILTAWHCIEDIFKDSNNNAIEIEYKGERILARLDEEKSIKGHDIAVLKIERKPQVNCIPLLKHLPTEGNQGSEVVTLGYSGVYKDDLQVFVGTISLIDKKYQIVVTNPIQGKGQSGGPLYHYATNRIVGVATDIFKEDQLRNSGLAAKFDVLFHKWPELSEIHKKNSQSWEERLQSLPYRSIKSKLHDADIEDNGMKQSLKMHNSQGGNQKVNNVENVVQIGGEETQKSPDSNGKEIQEAEMTGSSYAQQEINHETNVLQIHEKKPTFFEKLGVQILLAILALFFILILFNLSTIGKATLDFLEMLGISP
jgi:hypothetical protein